jgi:vacuolar-type H+-ATPase subunit F/Vma7
MSSVAAIGERERVQGFGLAGALTREAATPAEVRQAWSELPHDVAVVVLTPAAAQALADEPPRRAAPLTVVLPP